MVVARLGTMVVVDGVRSVYRAVKAGAELMRGRGRGRRRGRRRNSFHQRRLLRQLVGDRL